MNNTFNMNPLTFLMKSCWTVACSEYILTVTSSTGFCATTLVLQHVQTPPGFGLAL